MLQCRSQTLREGSSVWVLPLSRTHLVRFWLELFRYHSTTFCVVSDNILHSWSYVCYMHNVKIDNKFFVCTLAIHETFFDYDNKFEIWKMCVKCMWLRTILVVQLIIMFLNFKFINFSPENNSMILLKYVVYTLHTSCYKWAKGISSYFSIFN